MRSGHRYVIVLTALVALIGMPGLTLAGGGGGTTGGDDTAGVYNEATGFFFLRNTNDAGAADLTFQFGAGGAGYQAFSGRFSGTAALGTGEQVGIYNATNGTFYFDYDNDGGVADDETQFGPAPCASCIPVIGDWNDNGIDGIGLYDSSTGFYFLKDDPLSPGAADHTFQFGGGGGIPVAGDWTGTLGDGVGFFDAASATFFFRDTLAPGPADDTVAFGEPGTDADPVTGDFDNSGTQGLGLYDSSDGNQYRLRADLSPGMSTALFPYAEGNVRGLIGDWDND